MFFQDRRPCIQFQATIKLHGLRVNQIKLIWYILYHINLHKWKCKKFGKKNITIDSEVKGRKEIEVGGIKGGKEGATRDCQWWRRKD